MHIEGGGVMFGQGSQFKIMGGKEAERLVFL